MKISSKVDADKKRKNMDTEFQRKKAINFFIKYGLKNKPVIRKLGYRCRLVLSD